MYEDKLYWYKAIITGIHDGDTLRMEIDLGFTVHFLTPSMRSNLPMSLRVAGYDAPELGRADLLGEQARDAMLQWAQDHPGPYMIHTVKDSEDKYGRYLVDTITDIVGSDLIQSQIALGWLKPYTGSGPKPVWP